MKYTLLRWDYLNNMYSRVCKNLNFLTKDGSEDDRHRIYELMREKSELEESMEQLRYEEGRGDSHDK